MENGSLDQWIRVVQTAISPVVLISGVGLLLLSMTNRFAKTADRSRSLAKDMKRAEPEDLESIRFQIRVLYQRSQFLLLSIIFALASVLFVSLLIIYVFLVYLLGFSFHYIVSTLFIISVMSLVISLMFFIKDISLSLKALKTELKDHLQT